MKRANIANLRKMETELYESWKITEQQYKRFKELAIKKTLADYHNERNHISFAQKQYMQEINVAIGGFGAESFYPDNGNIWYINMGDAYNITIILKNNKLYIGTWVDIFEVVNSDSKSERIDEYGAR